MNKLIMGIVGHGFVGKAVDYGFDTPDVIKYIVDPNNNTTVDDMFDTFTPDVIFVSVPTPMSDDGTIDDSIIVSVFEQIKARTSESVVVVKSTVTPDVITRLSTIYSRMVYNPEFLTERNANFDFVNADFLIIGGPEAESEYLNYVYQVYSKCKQYHVYYTDVESASMIKYTLNCFLATKVLFFNQLKDIYEKSGTRVSWDAFTDVLMEDKRIGESHMMVPGPDGRYGFGGACFTKDTAALVRYARKIGSPFTLLEEAVTKNQEIRNQYSDLDSREKDQNVNFNLSLKD